MAVKDAKLSADKEITGMLLSAKERESCQRVASGEAPFSQRALALLFLDEGATQAAAGERAGLTSGQVKYWLAKFRKEGLAIFPAAPQVEAEPEPAAFESEAAKTPEGGTKKKKKPKAKAKAKKGKKPKKKAKKDKGAKKSKKGKKGKSATGGPKKKSKKKKK